MADPLNLSKLTELPPVRCYECGTIIGQSYEPYILMINTFSELVPRFKDEDSVQNFQYAWNAKREEHLNIVRQLRSMSLSNFNITLDDNQWRIIVELSKVYKNVLNRINTRKTLAQKALIELRENYLRNNNKPITVENSIIVNFDDNSIFEEIIKMRGTRKQITDMGFLNLSIDERLERVRYPSEINDSKWADLFREKLGVQNASNIEIEEALQKVLNIPKLTVLPEVTFSDNDWKRLSTTAKRVNILSQYGGVAMDALGYIRSCCRQNLAQPIILPMEAELETSEMQKIERMDPKTLIYSRFTLPLNMPTTEAERLFIEGKITSDQAFSEMYTRRALGVKSSFSANIVSPINAMTGGHVGMQFELPTQTSIGSGYGGIIVQTPEEMSRYSATETVPYQMRLPTPLLSSPASLLENVKPLGLPMPTFGGVAINTGSGNSSNTGSLPVPTFGGQPISTKTVQINKPIDIGTIPSFRKNKQRIDRQPRSQKQPGGLEIPLEEIPGDLKVFPAI